MIEILDLAKRREWLPEIEKELKVHVDLFGDPHDMIINKIMIQNLFCLKINNELTILCNTSLQCNKQVLFLYYIFGENMKNNLLEMINYARNVLNVDRVDWMCNSIKHQRFYEAIFKTTEATLKKEYYFRLTL